MSDTAPKDDKVRSLFGMRVPTLDTAKEIIEAGEKVQSMMTERKMVAYCGVCIDHEGLAHVVFSHDALKGFTLIGGLTYAAGRLAREMDDEMMHKPLEPHS